MGINLAGGQSIAVARAPIDMVQYTSPRTPAVLPYQYEVPAEMRTLRGARSYEVNPAMVKTAPYVISTLYGYKTGPVLFKPTKAAAKPFSPRSNGSAILLRLRQHSLPRGQGLCAQTVDGRPLREQWRALGGYHSARAGELFLYGYRWQGDQGGVHLRLLPRLRGPVAHQFAPLLLAFQAGVRGKKKWFYPP